jgi:uncharacterized protein (DUF2237 family)
VVCPDCKNQYHELCPGGTWCDCQCRIKPREQMTEAESAAAAATELTVLAQEEGLI